MPKTHLSLLLGSLFASGFASLVNQVVWQRALKVFLGGSEALSSMVVVFVFILGLGLGSMFLGARAGSLRNPLRALAIVEISLFAVNALVAFLLGLELSESVYSFQRVAVSSGIPLRVLYAISALVILGLPCFLMGTTVPIASEAAQRQLGYRNSSLIPRLFVLNTAGAVLGAAASGFFLLPYIGQLAALALAAAGNLAAGLAVLVLVLGAHRGPARSGVFLPSYGGERRSGGWFTVENSAGFVLGFLSLAYEMYLFRIMTLTQKPLPYTFALTLCLFLAFWTIGALLAARVPTRLYRPLLLGAALVAGVPWVYALHRSSHYYHFYNVGFIYFVPCLIFGFVFGHLASRSAARWGEDVGRFTAFNTIGSCLGILAVTLVGYEIELDFNGWAIALGLLGTVAYLRRAELLGSDRKAPSVLTAAIPASFAAVVVLVSWGLSMRFSERPDFSPLVENLRTYYGRDGVVEIVNGRDLLWDGLWHSSFTFDGEHVGTRNWYLAVAPAVCHDASPIREALVIGLGAGITARTLTGIRSVEQVDVYDINRRLEQVLEDYPDETLGVGSDPRIRLIWQDGRSGLALDPKRYDLITQQPLYLKQAGSSILLSREYLQLVKSRLKDDGVFCIYSNSIGNPRQSLLVRETARSVFEHCVSFLDGYLILASPSPLHLDEEKLYGLLQQPDAIYRDLTRYDQRLRAEGTTFLDSYDGDRLPWWGGGYVITDDHPLVEYPDVVTRLVRLPPETPKGDE